MCTLYLDQTLPDRTEAGRDFVWGFSGWASRLDARLCAVSLDLGGTVFAARAPLVRLDIDPAAGGRTACGFAGVALLPASTPPGRIEGTLRLDWDDGGHEIRSLGQLEVEAPVQAARVDTGRQRLVAICMATYNPDPALFRAQVNSLRTQTHQDWICLIQDDGSSAECWDAIVVATAGEPRFHLARNPANLGFYRNFERSLSRVPPEAAFVALADQDDVWHPDKLATLVEPLEAGAVLAYSDMRVVDRHGKILSTVFWPGRQGRHDSALALLTANVVTGCACLFRAELLERVLPFPLAGGRYAYHDHWVACCAAGAGRIVYVPQALSDYVQHGNNTLGYRHGGGRLIAKAAAAFALSPAVAVAAFLPLVHRRFARTLGQLVDAAAAEYLVRATFAETLRRRGLLPRDQAAYPIAGGVRRFLWGALLKRGHQGVAYRATALRLLAGLTVERIMRSLAGLLPKP